MRSTRSSSKVDSSTKILLTQKVVDVSLTRISLTYLSVDQVVKAMMRVHMITMVVHLQILQLHKVDL